MKWHVGSPVDGPLHLRTEPQKAKRAEEKQSYHGHDLPSHWSVSSSGSSVFPGIFVGLKAVNSFMESCFMSNNGFPPQYLYGFNRANRKGKETSFALGFVSSHISSFLWSPQTLKDAFHIQYIAPLFPPLAFLSLASWPHQVLRLGQHDGFEQVSASIFLLLVLIIRSKSICNIYIHNYFSCFIFIPGQMRRSHAPYERYT